MPNAALVSAVLVVVNGMRKLDLHAVNPAVVALKLVPVNAVLAVANAVPTLDHHELLLLAHRPSS